MVASYRRKLDEIAARPEVDRLVVVTPPAWKEPGGRTVALEPSNGTPAYELRVEPIRFNGSYHLFYWPNLGRVIRQVQPDLVHVDEEAYNLATFHGVRQASEAGSAAVFFTWQNLLRRYPPPFSIFEQRVFSQSAHAIAGSSEALAVLRRKGYRGGASIIPQFGVDPDLFSPGDARPSEPPTIGFISRLVEEKGLLVLLDALAGLKGDWRLHVIGAGPLEMQARRRAQRLGFAQRVIWERGVASTEVPGRLRTFSVFVQPSLTRANWKEQFGRAVLEAMACGVPVIGSSSGELGQVIGDAGIIVPEGDAVALRKALARLLDDCDVRAELARRGRARAVACYTNARIAEQTVLAYQAALTSSV